ncbi:MAG: adenosylcobinamide-GDP ribazoletransferase [Paucibacter sp.]|nr:adenosylcobinamide-GDP ribazoletransferase [Roseateles sp.]
MPVLHEIRLFFIALQFFTRLPLPRWVGFEPDWLQQCARYFPLVGLLVGMVSALVLWAAQYLWTSTIAVGLSMAATVLLTGAFHEDGWADTCDGLGGAVSREKALQIMKDSRIGSYGAVGLVLMLGLKAAALVSLADTDLDSGLLVMAWAHMASRLAPVWVMHSLPYAGDAAHAKAKPLATRISGAGVVVGSLTVLAAGALATWWQPDLLPLLCGSALVGAGACLGLQSWLERRLGGYTGDNLGAVQQIVELCILLTTLALWDFV